MNKTANYPANSAPITTLVADDCSLSLNAISALLRAQNGVKIVAKATNGNAAVQETTLQRPQLVVLDVGMPGLSGLDSASIIHFNYPETRILMVSGDERPEIWQQCLSRGADAFLAKSQLVSTFPKILAEWFPPTGR